MTSIPNDLIEAILTVLNTNSRLSIARDSQCLRRVRDMLVEAGCIEQVDLYDCAVNEDYVGATGCVDCGRHGVWGDEGLCNDCRGPAFSVAEYNGCEGCDDCAECPEYGDCLLCDD